ncbi:putative cyclase [Mycena floridula]|nr:putative cyclase [Mycena floridula]
MTTFIDLTHPLDPENISIYPGDPEFSCRQHASIDGDGYNVKALSLGSHTGTHIDAPAHFFADGKTIDQIPLASLCCPAIVIDLSYKKEREEITWNDLSAHAAEMNSKMMLLLRTDWSRYWGSEKYLDHPFLTRDAAERIVATGISVVGIDTFSPDNSTDFGVHQVILGSGGIIAENLTNLASLKTGYLVNLIPLNLRDADGSPVRAFAVKPVSDFGTEISGNYLL